MRLWPRITRQRPRRPAGRHVYARLRRHRSTRRLLGYGSVLVVMPLSILGITAPAGHAADGTILRTVTAENYTCAVGTGVAFDGTNLLLSCDSDNTITAVSPVDGHFVRSYTISGVSAIGALAWDRGRNLMWACGGFNGDDTIVYKINLDTSTATQAFSGTQGCPDGLAFDGTNDTLYLSADVATMVQHYKADGTLIENIDVTGKLGNCGNSGIAVGGSYLFLANDGCSQIYRSPKNDVSAPALFGSYPQRLEDMECDDLTFRADGKAAIWSKDAYDGILNAFELNVGDCGFGGQPSGSGDVDTDGDGLPDSWETNGVDFNHDGKIDLDLKAMGADPKHKDLFIETDWMVKPKSCIWFICWGGENYAPQQAALSDVRTAYANAPVTNPDGTTGIRAHIDSGPASVMNPVTNATWGGLSRANQVPFKEIIGSSDGGNNYNWVDFDNIRNANFDVARRNAFHYMVYVDMFGGAKDPTDCPSGLCWSGLSRAIAASDTIVSDGHPSWGAGFTRIQERGTVMHELGHNLNLRHGGDTEDKHRPGYASIMSYTWQLDGLPPNHGLDYSRGAPFVDWDHLVFTGGSVGAFGDVAPPATTKVEPELDAASAKAAGEFATNGDGTVSFVGPTIVLPGGGPQKLVFTLANVSMASSTYTLQLDAPGLPVAASKTVTIPAGANQRVEMAVDDAKLKPGAYDVTAHLSSTTAGSDLSTDNATITVPDLTDPAQLQQAQDALAKLRQLPADSGLDLATRDALSASLVSALPWKANVAIIGAPKDVLNANYTINAPVLKPGATNPATITIAGRAGSPAFALSLTRLAPAGPAYRGTIHLLRPDGRIVDGIVTLVWSPTNKVLQGALSPPGGGAIKVTLTAP